MIEFLKADITTLQVDAIVNSANSALSGGGGVDGAIHRAAGPELLAACRALGRCPVGRAVVTPGFRLRARLVIHAVGPAWGGDGESRLLEQVYQHVFALAEQQAVKTIALPAISAGGAEIALQAMRAHQERFEQIVVCLPHEATFEAYRRVLARPSSATA